MRKQNSTVVKLLNLLADGEYHPGDELGKRLRITRSAVWKAITKLKSYGIHIEALKGTGYLLKEPIHLLDSNKIMPALHDQSIKLDIFECIGSTNDYLQQLKHPKGIHICLSEMQEAGKGRLGRDWYSPFATNIYLSCLYPLEMSLGELGGLSLVVSLAILNAIKITAPSLDVKVKWPNDVMVSGKKIAGSLVLVQAESHGKCQAIIGIGLNVNMQDDDHHIKQDYTSLKLGTGESFDRNTVVAVLINELFRYLAEFRRDGFSRFIDEWKKQDLLHEKMIAVNHVNNIVRGEVVGINQHGHLLLRLQEDIIKAFTSGDVTIVK